MQNKKEVYHPINRHKWTIGQRIADRVTKLAGSWTFIIILSLLLIIWFSINIYELFYKFDPYPFVFLNLILGIINVIFAPMILMSQNRESQRDRVRAEYDYELNKKAEKEIQELKKQLDRIEKKFK
jgi:uncharacterized membrane protein